MFCIAAPWSVLSQVAQSTPDAAGMRRNADVQSFQRTGPRRAIAQVNTTWLATRLPGQHRLRTGLVAAVVAGLVAGATAFVGISIVASLKVHFLHLHWEQPWQTGLITATSLSAFAMIGVVVVVCATIGGIVLFPVRYFQLRIGRLTSGRLVRQESAVTPRSTRAPL
jgi:hypothetical protein